MEQGLRQGDPISPYLFICVVEAFIALLAKVELKGHIHGVHISPTPHSLDLKPLFCL